MRLVLAVFFPFVLFFTIGRPIAGIVCLLLQLTLIAWLPAMIWALYALSKYDEKKLINTLKESGASFNNNQAQ